MDETGARINIPPPSMMKNDISVAGDKDSVAKAVAQVKKIWGEMVRALLLLSFECLVYSFHSPSPPLLLLFFSLCLLSHFLLFFPSFFSPPLLSLLSPSPFPPPLLFSLSSPFPSSFLLQKRTCSTVSVEVRKSQHKYIIGPRGQGLQEILQTTGWPNTSTIYTRFMCASAFSD